MTPRERTSPAHRWPSPSIIKSYTRSTRYEVVGDFLSSEHGRVLDAGARDRILERFIGSADIRYESGDLEGTHDHKIDLEQPLSFEDQEFDHVVALDVLEHVETIHQTFSELSRIARRTLAISLPNIAVATRRVQFALKGNIGGKYALLPSHQGDRHRWVTIYPEIYPFVDTVARQSGFRIERVVEEVVVTRRPYRYLAWLLLRTGRIPSGLLVERCIFVLRRQETTSTSARP